ncbi:MULTISPECIES: hypothetical protein [unclassified Streptomyces]|uniref:hypothetical protein n=1 Tax=Streptomyces sp. AVP053U2 TaxID=1737066 RepID=UPI0005A71257|nr:hypothetical protein APS67_005464 [Streptomyces sp. AVP053U2]
MTSSPGVVGAGRFAALFQARPGLGDLHVGEPLQPNGHEGVHTCLVDDFVTAGSTRALPSVSARAAARRPPVGTAGRYPAENPGLRGRAAGVTAATGRANRQR